MPSNASLFPPLSRPACGARLVALTLLLCCATLRAAEPLPARNRIPASIERTLAAPVDQPMHMPTDVAIDRQGRVYVADGANDRVLRFAPDGKLEAPIPQSPDQSLKRPTGLFIDAASQLWIADTGNHRLVLISADGAKTTPILPQKFQENDSFDPTDLAVTPDGKRTYVVDNDNHRILIRDNQTLQWTAMGKPGRALGQFQWPFMICLGQENYVYVTEAIGSRLQTISPTDRWAGEIGRWGVELGQFYRPKGVAADPQGRLFVTDSTTGVIQVFTARGAVIGALTNPDGTPLRFQHPMGLSFDPQGRLYVVELAANRIAIVSLSEQKQ